jgi:hypothetical protein
MALVCPDEGEVLLFKYMLNHTTPADVILRLYTSNTTPAEGSTFASFTEATEAGYANVTLTGGTDWTINTTTNVTTAQYAQQVFSFTTAATVYGYFQSDNAGTTCLIAERFDGAPFTLPSGGGQITVTPKITLD